MEAEETSCTTTTDCVVDYMECANNKCSCIFPRIYRVNCDLGRFFFKIFHYSTHFYLTDQLCSN